MRHECQYFNLMCACQQLPLIDVEEYSLSMIYFYDKSHGGNCLCLQVGILLVNPWRREFLHICVPEHHQTIRQIIVSRDCADVTLLRLYWIEAKFFQYVAIPRFAQLTNKERAFEYMSLLNQSNYNDVNPSIPSNPVLQVLRCFVVKPSNGYLLFE